jgi:hypothetical protein
MKVHPGILLKTKEWREGIGCQVSGIRDLLAGYDARMANPGEFLFAGITPEVIERKRD